MIKRILSLLIITCISFVGCSKPKENTDSSINATPPQTTHTQNDNTATQVTISDITTTPTKYDILGKLLFLPNKANNNKLTNLSLPENSGYIDSKKLVETFDHNIESLVVVDNDIYFTSISNNNSIYKLDYIKDELSLVKETNAYNLTHKNNKLYFINFDTNMKLLSYDLVSNLYETVINDKVGKYIINGDFIFYQNLDDNSSLYSMTLDGLNRKKLTNFSVESFAALKGQLYISNSSDNNSIYRFDPLTNTCKRIAIIDAVNIKSTKDTLYFIDPKSNSLYNLIIDEDKKTYNPSEILFHNVNDYFLSEKQLFLELSNNINETYILNID